MTTMTTTPATTMTTMTTTTPAPTRTRIFGRSLALGLAVLAAGACRDDAPLTPKVELPSSIEVEPAQLQIASLSDTVSVTARVLDASGQVLEGIGLIWTLEGEPTLEAVGSGTGAATSTSPSRWQAIANGRSTLRVAVDPQAGYGSRMLSTSVDVQVRQVPTLLELPSERIELWSLGETRVLEATARDARQNPIEFLADSIVWRVDDTEIARIDVGGRLLALGDGEATLTAELGGLTQSAAVSVESAIVVEGCFAVGGTPLESGCLITRLRLQEKGD